MFLVLYNKIYLNKNVGIDFDRLSFDRCLNDDDDDDDDYPSGCRAGTWAFVINGPADGEFQ